MPDYVNAVIDISHHESHVDLGEARNSGVVAVIHKATNGIGGNDMRYAGRRHDALKAGLLWGAFHFGTGDGTGKQQAEHFLSTAAPGDEDVMSVDVEPNVLGKKRLGPDINIEQTREFVDYIHNKTGRYPMVYGAAFLKKLLENALEEENKTSDPVLSNCPLWVARYEDQGKPPLWAKQVWKMWTLWQYTDGTDGVQPHNTPGIGHCDRNFYSSTLDNLKARWRHNLRA